MSAGELDTGRLYEFLSTHRPGLVRGPLAAELIVGGRSNLTYTVTDGTHRWILRRPPLGHVLATAHDMSREFRVMTALVDTGVPVPRMLLLHEDPDLLGAPFYLMAEVRGTVYRSPEQAADLGAERAQVLSRQLVDVLAELHAVDPGAVGLADFGRPEGFLDRQVRRWGKQLAESRSRELPELDELGQSLGGTVPVNSRHAVVHGDYRLDNTIVAEGRIQAVVDWEMATLGDPLADLGLLLVYWTLAAELPDNPIGGASVPEAGFLTADELARHYAARSGADLADLPWYVAFGHFKLAVIAEGIHYRNLQGLTVGPGFDRIGALVTPLVQRGLAALG